MSWIYLDGKTMLNMDDITAVRRMFYCGISGPYRIEFMSGLDIIHHMAFDTKDEQISKFGSIASVLKPMGI